MIIPFKEIFSPQIFKICSSFILLNSQCVIKLNHIFALFNDHFQVKHFTLESLLFRHPQGRQ